MVSASESHRLFTAFAEQASKIDVALNEKDVENSRTLIHELQALVSSHAAVLPARDLQSYSERIESYKKKLDDIKAPKKRFAFSRTTKEAHEEKVQGPDQKTGGGGEYVLGTPQEQKQQQVDTGGDVGVCEVASTTFILEGKQGEALELNDVDGEVELRKLDKCRIVIRGCPSTLYVNDVHECEVVCDPVASSVLIVGFRDSSLQVACQQLRVHKAVRATFQLHITSRSIIEECKDIIFGPLRADYLPSDESWTRSGLDRSKNHFSAVDDFNWLNTSQPSPHWKLVE